MAPSTALPGQLQRPSAWPDRLHRLPARWAQPWRGQVLYQAPLCCHGKAGDPSCILCLGAFGIIPGNLACSDLMHRFSSRVPRKENKVSPPLSLL